MDIPVYFRTVDGHFGCFPFITVTDNVALNILGYVIR